MTIRPLFSKNFRDRLNSSISEEIPRFWIILFSLRAILPTFGLRNKRFLKFQSFTFSDRGIRGYFLGSFNDYTTSDEVIGGSYSCKQGWTLQGNGERRPQSFACVMTVYPKVELTLSYKVFRPIFLATCKKVFQFLGILFGGEYLAVNASNMMQCEKILYFLINSFIYNRTTRRQHLKFKVEPVQIIIMLSAIEFSSHCTCVPDKNFTIFLKCRKNIKVSDNIKWTSIRVIQINTIHNY